MARLTLSLLGSPRIELAGKPVEVDTRKAIALLVHLAVTGQAHRRDTVATLLPKIRLDTVALDDDTETLVEAIAKHARSETIGDGKIWLTTSRGAPGLERPCIRGASEDLVRPGRRDSETRWPRTRPAARTGRPGCAGGRLAPAPGSV